MSTNWWLYGRYLIMEPMIKGIRILDVGCGNGFLSGRLARKGFEMVSLDISKKALVAINNLQITNNTKRINLILADAQSIPLRNDVFDSVIHTDVLEHLVNDEKALDEIYRVLKPDGIGVISVPTLKFLFSEFDKQIGHYRRYDRTEVEVKLKKRGFNIISLRYWNTFSIPIVFILRKILRKESSISNLVKPSSLKDSIFKNIVRIEKILSFPFGLSIIIQINIKNKKEMGLCIEQ